MRLFFAALASFAPATNAQGGLISNFGCGGFAEFQHRIDSVEQACCGNSDCPAGVPATCSVNCALVFSPFYEACGLLIGRMLDDDAEGTAQIDAFDQLDTQCRSAVDLPSALGIIAALRDDDSDFLMPELDGFETYRHTDPQQLASQGHAIPSCASGWTDSPGYASTCCDNLGRCGQRCPPQAGQQDCIVSVVGDMSDCPASAAHDPITQCTQGSAQRCTPRECAAACINAHGCVSFRYNKQDEVGPNGQRLRDYGCGGTPRPASGVASYCSFSYTCTVDTPSAVRSGVSDGSDQFGDQQTSPWHFYMRRADDNGNGGHH